MANPTSEPLAVQKTKELAKVTRQIEKGKAILAELTKTRAILLDEIGNL